MRFFQKRRDGVDDVESNYMYASNINVVDHDHTVNGRSSFQKDALLLHSREQQSTSRTVEYKSKDKQSIRGLVRKLNCSASKKYDEEDFTVGVQIGEIQGYSENSPNRCILSPSRRIEPNPSSDITRPVLITVKDGDIPKPTQKGRTMEESKSSLVVGDLSTPSSFRLGMSARKRQNNATNVFTTASKETNGNCNGTIGKWKQQQKNARPQSVEAIRATQELARRERWRRGLEQDMMKTASGRGARTGGDWNKDDSWSDAMSHTTGTSGHDDTTGENSSLGDWTDATDDSHHHHFGFRRYGRSSTLGQCASREQVVRAVTEDAEIFANLILSDGYACLGTAAAITRETVEGCHADGY